MFFFLNLDLSYQRYQNAYFDLCADVVYPAGEKLFRPYLLIFAPIKGCLDVYDVEYPC